MLTYRNNFWHPARAYWYDGTAWIDAIRQSEDSAIQLISAFDETTYIGRGTVLQRNISHMPIDDNSDAMAQFMWDWSPFYPAGAWGSRTSINTSSYGTQPIHMYIVDSTDPNCTFQAFNVGIDDNSVTTNIEQSTYMKGDWPLPSWAVPAQNGDYGISVYDKGTGIMREVFYVVKDDSGAYRGVGGYSITTPGLNDLSTTNYALQQRCGLSNVAGMHNSIGFVGIAEAFNKKINHALCFTIATGRMNNPDGTQRISWPSRGTDGKLDYYMTGGKYAGTWSTALDSVKTPTHGQWGRLKASVDPKYNPRTKEPFTPFTQLLIQAAKTYGLVPTDTNMWCHAFNCEQGRTFAHCFGEDPWKSGGIIDKLYRDPWGNGGLNANDFPWDQTEWAPIDWGRPSPDMNLRPRSVLPWYRA